MLDLDEKMFFEKVNQNRENCVVLVSKATCPICQQVTPLIEELEQNYAEQPVQFYHIDSVKNKSLLERLNMKGVPQVLFFQHGESRGKYAGIRDEVDYKNKVEEILAE